MGAAIPAFALPALAQPSAFSRAGAGVVGASGSSQTASDPKGKAHSAAVNFEAQFLNSMFSQMLSGVDSDGPFGGGKAVGVWRSFLTEQYAKAFAQKGGIGIADKVYHALLAQQEVGPSGAQ